MKRLASIVGMLLFAGMLCAQSVLGPTAPSNLAVAPVDNATYPNLQALGSGGWTVLYGNSCCGGSNSGTGTGAWGIASPSLSGGSMSLTNVYTGGSGNGLNAQMYTVLDCSVLSGASCLSANNIKAEVHFYIPSSSATPQALEGPDVILYDGTDQEYPSLQCRVSGSDWWVWNSFGGAWVDTGNSCSAALTTNTWHDLVANYTIDGVAHTLGYVSATLDGSSIGALGQSYGGITDSSSVALKAQVQLDGNEAGASTTAINYDKYDVTVTTNPVAATPTASPVAGSYSSTQSVTLTSSTAGASIYYTTDGSTPTTSSTLYTGAISVASTTTIKALAAKSGYTQSGVFSGTYTITGGSTTLSLTPTSVAEGSIPTNTTAYFQPVTVTNTGSSNLTFSAIGFTGTNSGDFSITPGFTPYGNAVLSTVSGYTSLFPSCTTTTPTGCPVTCSTSVPVAPGASCVVPIDFVPGASSARSASLQFTDNASGSPHTVALTGTGTAASGTLLTSSNCNTLLSASTSYYFGGDISCNGSGFGLNGPNITVNQNGYTLTIGASPAYVGISSYGYYAAGSGDPAYTSPCVPSGVAHGCATGTTPTTQDTYNDVIENGTIVLAGGATSAGTEQAGDEAIYPSYIPAENSDIYLHDMTVSIPVWCISCNVEGGLYGTTNTYNGVGDRVWKVTANNNSGQVQTRCEYEGASFLFANSSGTNDPGPIAYENTLTGSPQDGFAITTPHAYVFGNTIDIGNANGTDAGTSSTCSGIGTGTYGTQSANDFAIGAYGNYGSVVNNNINTQSRGIDLTAGSSPGYTYSAGNTIASTVINNYVEYQGNGGNELGGALGVRFNNFGVSSPGTYSSGDSVTVTCGTSEGSAYSISNNATAGSHADTMILTAKYGSGSAKDYNCNGVQDVSQAYDGSVLFTFNGGTVTSDTSDINIGNEEDGSSGPLAFVGTTFVKPATATAGWCGNSSFSIPEAGWVLTMACYPGYVNGNPIGPVYYVNPIFSGGAAYPDDDFAMATTYLPSSTVASSYLMYTYQVTVTGASSGSPIVGATVTATDTHSGLECTATTNGSGVASCNGAPGSANAPLNTAERSFTAPAAPTTTTFNPFGFSISKSGCGTNTYSESITGPTVDTKTLSGC